ncbi:YidB family protein [Streptomyces sp. NPDC093252]|uniref:YidB family protein n=1 Tax=Streptomyces sp. NPDC093252 TaxID=3154980 RepID=UPI0034302B4C
MAGNDLGSLLGGLLGGGKQQSGGSGGSGGGSASGGGGSGASGAVAILGSLLGSLMASKGGTGGTGGTGAAATGGAAQNPLGGLVDLLQKSGLVDQAQSWISQGQNKPVSGAQIKEALPDETLSQVARESGVSTDRAADELASVLPQAVDRLTPQGEVPSGSLEDIIKQQRL